MAHAVAIFLAGLFLSTSARADGCGTTCRGIGDGSRRAALACEVACERQDPAKIKYCPEYTPCILACEEQIPEESIQTQPARDQKTTCNGVCMTQYFRIDCAPVTAVPDWHGQASPIRKSPPGDHQEMERPAGETNTLGGFVAQDARAHGMAKGRESTLNLPPRKPGRESEVRSGPGGILGASASSTAEKGAAPVADLMKAMLDDKAKPAALSAPTPISEAASGNLYSPTGTEELTIFQRVHRKYREKQTSLAARPAARAQE